MLIEDQRIRNVIKYENLNVGDVFTFIGDVNTLKNEICMKTYNMFVLLSTGECYRQDLFLQDEVLILNAKLVIK